MSYVLGSDRAAVEYDRNGIIFRPHGTLHAVDPTTEINRKSETVGYAVCGALVRVWPDRPFDPSAEAVHDRCAGEASS